MTLDSFFTLANGFAGVGWLVILLLSPRWKRYDAFVIGIVVAVLAVAYTILNFSNPRSDILQKFGTLNGVMELFQSKALVMAAWCHILAFDLIGGIWMKKNSLKFNIGHAWLIIPFLVTIALGPLGFLLYLLVRWIKTKNYFAEN